MLKELQSGIGTLWCGLMHESVMWPVHGEYECRTCGRRYPAFADTPGARWPRPSAFKAAAPLMLLLAGAAFVSPAHAGNATKGHPALEAKAALERYAASGAPVRWPVETIEIHAAMPKLSKTGVLLAIRRLELAGDSSYQVIQFTGDSTVKRQVIVRYLNAEARPPKIPAESVAITPANYKFAYKGEIDDGERLAYAFQITPRTKRDGLIKGELWIDQGTGAPLLVSGRLVKSPSLWIKQVSVTQENTFSDGAVESRLTHIYVDTRLVGRAELVIEERPLRPADSVQFAISNKRGGQQ